ncbi:hypothetical protein V8E36_007128 [Tilletia maclaganii]
MPFAEKHVGYWLACLLPTVVFALCPFVLCFDRNLYHSIPPQGSVLGASLRLLWFASKGRWSSKPIRTYRQLTAADFWTNALPSKQVAATGPAWVKACAVFGLYLLYWLCYNHISNNLVSQPATMTLNGVPNEIISNNDPLAILIFMPLMDLVFYPLTGLLRLHIHHTPLQPSGTTYAPFILDSRRRRPLPALDFLALGLNRITAIPSWATPSIYHLKHQSRQPASRLQLRHPHTSFVPLATPLPHTTTSYGYPSAVKVSCHQVVPLQSLSMQSNLQQIHSLRAFGLSRRRRELFKCVCLIGSGSREQRSILGQSLFQGRKVMIGGRIILTTGEKVDANGGGANSSEAGGRGGGQRAPLATSVVYRSTVPPVAAKSTPVRPSQSIILLGYNFREIFQLYVRRLSNVPPAGGRHLSDGLFQASDIAYGITEDSTIDRAFITVSCLPLAGSNDMFLLAVACCK